MEEKKYKKFDPLVDFSVFDHIVVGSGIGGLTAAIWLAKAGARVAVLERHYVPGGFTHVFKRKAGFQWDVGVHYVGNLAPQNPMHKLFGFISGGKLRWESMGEVYDKVHIGKETYLFKAGKQAFRDQMVSYFPQEATAIDAYLTLIEKSNKRASLFFIEKAFKPLLSKTLGRIFIQRFRRYSQKTTREVLQSITSNPQLIAVLCAQCGNYGLTPGYSSFAAHALVVGHFLEGGYYPVGGTAEIGKTMLEVLQSLGSEVFVHADVQQITTTNRRVSGLMVNGHPIPAKSVISNAGAHTTYGVLLSERDRSFCGFVANQMPPSSGHLCLYVGLNASAEALNLPRHNVWFFSGPNFDEIIDRARVDNLADHFAYISFPSAKDPAWSEKHPNTATIQALTVGKYEWFAPYENQPWMKREEAYKAMKHDFETAMLQRLYALFPQIEGHVVVTEVSTPLSTRHFTNYAHGEIYGLAHTPARFEQIYLRPETKIEGLRLVGQDITLVGLAGAMLSGLLCVSTILKFRMWKMFRAMARQTF